MTQHGSTWASTADAAETQQKFSARVGADITFSRRLIVASAGDFIIASLSHSGKASSRIAVDSNNVKADFCERGPKTRARCIRRDETGGPALRDQGCCAPPRNS